MIKPRLPTHLHSGADLHFWNFDFQPETSLAKPIHFDLGRLVCMECRYELYPLFAACLLREQQTILRSGPFILRLMD